MNTLTRKARDRKSYNINRQGALSMGVTDDNRPTFYDAKCVKCKAPCKVPFQPIPRKAVYCSIHFHPRGVTNG